MVARGSSAHIKAGKRRLAAPLAGLGYVIPDTGLNLLAVHQEDRVNDHIGEKKAIEAIQTKINHFFKITASHSAESTFPRVTIEIIECILFKKDNTIAFFDMAASNTARGWDSLDGLK